MQALERCSDLKVSYYVSPEFKILNPPRNFIEYLSTKATVLSNSKKILDDFLLNNYFAELEYLNVTKESNYNKYLEYLGLELPSYSDLEQWLKELNNRQALNFLAANLKYVKEQITEKVSPNYIQTTQYVKDLENYVKEIPDTVPSKYKILYKIDVKGTASELLDSAVDTLEAIFTGNGELEHDSYIRYLLNNPDTGLAERLRIAEIEIPNDYLDYPVWFNEISKEDALELSRILLQYSGDDWYRIESRRKALGLPPKNYHY